MRKINFMATTFKEEPNVTFLYPFPLGPIPVIINIKNPFTAAPTEIKIRGSSSRCEGLHFYKEMDARPVEFTD